MTIREKLSTDYLYFRYPVEYLLVLLPPIIGIISHIFSSQFMVLEEFKPDTITIEMTAGIDSYLIASKLSAYLLIAIFCSYRWSAMRTDGSFSFWISLGITRRKFFSQTIWKFLFLLFLGQLLGAIIIMYLNFYILDPISLVLLTSGVLTHLFLSISIAIFLSTYINQSEISALTFIGVMTGNYFLFIDTETIANGILHSDLQYISTEGWLPITIALTVSFVINYFSFRAFNGQDIDS